MSAVSRGARVLSPSARTGLEKLRRACGPLGDYEERTSFGHPAFYAAGKSFAIIDFYDGTDCLWLRIDCDRRSELLRTPGWFASPYDPRRDALCCQLKVIDWRRIRPLLRRSYEIARLPKKNSPPRPRMSASR